MPAETPTASRVLIFEPYWFALNIYDAARDCREETLACGYKVIHHFERKAGLDPVVSLSLFKTHISSGDFGVIHIVSHGSPYGFDVEVYSLDAAGFAARNAAFDRYVAKGYNKTGDEIFHSSSHDGYAIAVTPGAIRSWYKDAKSIVVLSMCGSAHLIDSWRAREVLGGENESGETQAGPFNACLTRFYRRLSGALDRGAGNAMREVGAAVANLDPDGILVHRGFGNTVLCPIVLDYGPKRELVRGQATSGFVEFDSTMERTDPAGVVTVVGSDTVLTNQRWASDTRLELTAQANRCWSPSEATFTVVAANARSKNNGRRLDGGRAWQGGVRPNGDDFVWTVECAPSDPRPA